MSVTIAVAVNSKSKVPTEKELISKIAGGARVTVTKSNLWAVMAEAMKQVELFAGLSGAEKRRLVLNALQQLVQDQPDLNTTDKASLTDTILNTLPGVIDLVVNPASLGLNLARQAARCCRGKTIKVSVQSKNNNNNSQ